jgi:hypothetical protein
LSGLAEAFLGRFQADLGRCGAVALGDRDGHRNSNPGPVVKS